MMMNATQYSYLINNPSAVNVFHGVFLDKVIAEFPFFQSPRALRLKSLYNEQSYSYNQELRKTAAHTTDRSVLFEFITSDNFLAVQKKIFQQKKDAINDINVYDLEIVVPILTKADASLEQTTEDENNFSKLELSILDSIEKSEIEKKPNIYINSQHIIADSVLEHQDIEDKNQSLEKLKIEQVQQKLEIGKPLPFSKFEKHSFEEWLQLANFKPIERENELTITVQKPNIEDDKLRKLDLIDKFIANNPKISSVKNYVSSKIILEAKPQDSSYIMTETLAKVYLEQKKYQKAIQAYEILILKYPEKISFFADRITDIKELQQNIN